MSNDNTNQLEDLNPNGGGAEAAPGTARVVNLNNESIGYCHVCDKQVIIDTVAFCCSECQGGFIELFENDNNNNTNQQQQQQQQQPSINLNDPNSRIRMESIRFNESNMANLLPLLLPQLLNQQNIRITNSNTQAGGGAVLNPTNQTNANPSDPTQQQQQFMPNPNNISQMIGPTTRLQFIVPGEQFDLYGVINNVLSDLLDPRRMNIQPGFHASTNMPSNGPQQFHFQSPPIRMFQLHGLPGDYAWGASGLDTIITQLLNQLDTTGPPPATEQQLNNLPLVKINQEEFDNNVQCSICMEDFKLNEEAKKLPCKHYFHTQCITEWLKLHGTCPVCRKNLNGEDTSQREYIAPSATNPQQSTQSDSATSETASSAPSTTSTNPSTSNPSDLTTTNPNPNPDTNPNNREPNPSVYNDMEFD